MLEIIINLVPQGDRLKTKQLGKVQIFNDLSGTETHGNYGARFFRSNHKKPFLYRKMEGFPRKRLNAFHLLALFMAKAFWVEISKFYKPKKGML